jgi:hypothetical protein
MIRRQEAADERVCRARQQLLEEDAFQQDAAFEAMDSERIGKQVLLKRMWRLVKGYWRERRTARQAAREAKEGKKWLTKKEILQERSSSPVMCEMFADFDFSAIEPEEDEGVRVLRVINL